MEFDYNRMEFNYNRSKMNKIYIDTGKIVYKTLSKRAKTFDDPGQFLFGTCCSALIMIGYDYLPRLDDPTIDAYATMIKENVKNNLTMLATTESENDDEE